VKKFYQVSLVITLLFGPAFSGAENITVSLVTPSAAYMDHFTAIEKGYFREQNLNVEYIRAGGGVATPALMSGELHFSTSAGLALSAALRGGPLKMRVVPDGQRSSWEIQEREPIKLTGDKLRDNRLVEASPMLTVSESEARTVS
jgi:ABC-type nitrate/sulfonate/bicarbonate transport system substrate-binding protein